MKKNMALLLIAAFIFTLTGCNTQSVINDNTGEERMAA